VESAHVRGGKDRQTWQEAFIRVRAEIEELEARIQEQQEELRASAGDDWSFSPTGGGPPQDPEVVKLRSSLRRNRQSLDAARQELRELEVEASLAEVPESWRYPDED
jgi:DNA repair exonuclease SbcCD ATPase subunit